MKRLLAVALPLALVFAACGDDDDPEVSAATTTSADVTTTVPTQSATAAPKTTKAPTTTTNAGDPPGLVPADSQTPVAGSCSNSYNGIAEIVLNPDVPSPRCMIVKDTDHLRVENNFEFEVTVSDGSGTLFTLKPGANDTGMKAIGGYWATGVHRLKITNTATKAVLYGGGGPEVWLK
jgi:hypothetical protein